MYTVPILAMKLPQKQVVPEFLSPFSAVPFFAVFLAAVEFSSVVSDVLVLALLLWLKLHIKIGMKQH